MCRVKDGWIGSIRDLREELKIEARLQQAAQLEAVGRVAGGVAHDFNNLLTVIGGNLELIQMSTTQDEDHNLTEIFEDVFSAVDHGAVLVGHLQSFTHDQAYQPALLNIEDVLIAFCETVVKSFRSSITVKQEVTENLLVRVDERALKGALLNIALNAQDAMEHGGTLSIRSRVQWIAEKDQERFGGIPTGEYVAIETQDTGRGIPAGLLSRITEPFFTGNSSGSGSGLGLSMVKHFVEQSTGGLEITSCEGRGTTVTILLPHISETDAVRAKTEWAATVDQAAGRVLLVEDSDSVRKYAKRCLSRMGYEVVTARNGVDALEQLERSCHFDLIFSDVVMPGGVSGHDLAAHAEELLGSGTLVLLTSGYISEEQRDSHNHWNYLRKPYTASQLGRRIQELLLEQDTRT
jgi:nitrogen-specific signal transduction histidine kinase/CheY-like chemotaxis protein